MSGRRGLAALGFLAAAVLVFPPSVQGGPLESKVKVKVAKTKSGPYRSNQTVKVPANGKRTIYVKVTSVVNEHEIADFNDGATEPNGYKIRWYRGGDDISADVEGDGYPFVSYAKKSISFSATIKETASSGNGTCLISQVDPEEGLITQGYMGLDEPCA